jgi:hypothetical protein
MLIYQKMKRLLLNLNILVLQPLMVIEELVDADVTVLVRYLRKALLKRMTLKNRRIIQQVH